MSDESQLEEIANRTGKNEPRFAKSVGALGLIGLAAIPIVGWLAAAYTAAIGSGLLFRYLQRKPRHAYKARRALNKIYAERHEKERALLRRYV